MGRGAARVEPEPVGAGLVGGHCVPAVAYDARGVWVVSWGREYLLTWAAFGVYVTEAWAVLGPDWTSGGKPAPNGMDLASLEIALRAV